jgi:hypothetical protein
MNGLFVRRIRKGIPSNVVYYVLCERVRRECGAHTNDRCVEKRGDSVSSL